MDTQSAQQYAANPLASSEATMRSILSQNNALRDMINARQERAVADGQDPAVTTPQTAASGDADYSLPTSAAASAQPAAPAAGPPAPTPPPAANNSNAILVSESNRRLQSMRNAEAAPVTPQQPVASGGAPTDLKRLQALQRAAGSTWGAGPMEAQLNPPPQASDTAPAAPQPNVRPTRTQIVDENSRLKQLQSLDAETKPAASTQVTRADPRASVADRFNNPGNLKFAGQPGAVKGPVLPDGTSFAVFPDMQTGLNAAHSQLALDMSRGNNTVQGLINKWSPANGDGNSRKSTDAYIARVSSLLGVSPTQALTPASIPKMAQIMYGVEAGHPAGTQVPTGGSAPQGQPQQAAAPAQQTGAPAQPGQPQGVSFTAGDGSKFTLPQAYNDGQIQQMQQNAKMAQNAAQLAWMQYQHNPSQQTMAQYQQTVGQVQQLHQGLYDADVYAKTQQAQAGNPQAFSALLNEYSSKVGQPIQMRAEGNGLYSAVAKGGQVIAHGSPADIAGTFGGVLNSAARAQAMHLAVTRAEAYATESGKADANLPTELAKLQNALRIKFSENDTSLLKQALENQKPTTVQLTGGQVVYVDPSNKTSPVSVINPNEKTLTGGATVQRPILKPPG